MDLLNVKCFVADVASIGQMDGRTDGRTTRTRHDPRGAAHARLAKGGQRLEF